MRNRDCLARKNRSPASLPCGGGDSPAPAMPSLTVFVAPLGFHRIQNYKNRLDSLSKYDILISQLMGNYRHREPQRPDGLLEMSSTYVYRVLRDEILSRKLKPGERLVRRVVAKRLGVSPLPVLEALYKLEKEGLVENRPLSGACVTDLTQERLTDVLVMREALESQVARILAQSLTGRQLKLLVRQAKVLDRLMLRRQSDDKQGMELHMSFHLAMARMTGHPILEQELRRVWSQWFMRLAWIGAAMGLIEPDWHGRLVQAIAGGDVRRADEAARYHVRRSPEDHEAFMRKQAQALVWLQNIGGTGPKA